MAAWNPEADVSITDSEDDDEMEQRNYRGREAMLFVVDANLYENPDIFMEALNIIRGAFISGMLVNGKDLLGLVFANTEMSPEPYEPNCLDNIVVPENCAVFMPLRQLTKPIVEHYLQFIVNASEQFGEQYGIAANGGCGSFYKLIRLCINLFDNCGFALNNSTLVFMTARDTPHTPQSTEYRISLQKAADLGGKEIEFHVTPMVDDFNYDVFYKEFLCLVKGVELDSFVKPDAQLLREMLADRKLKQDYLKRSLGHFNFALGPNLEISALYFHFFHKRCYPRKVKLRPSDNAIVEKKRAIMLRKQDDETLEFTQEREVKANEGWHEILLGDMVIRVTNEQINRVRNLHKPGMMLLGFKPRSELDVNSYYMPSNFMYPDDGGIIGSKRLFRALWERCLERDKIAIGIFMRRRKSIPRYVALVPMQTSDNDTKDFHSLMTGDGFKIVYLPMAKHIRHIDFTSWNSNENTAPAEGVELFKKIIGKLTVRYQPQLINDPQLEHLQANLLALSLNIVTENEGVTDMPDAGKQDERIAPLLTDIEKIFGEDVAPPKKRTAPEMGGNAPKMVKITEDDIKRYDYVEQVIANKAVNNCTVPQLLFILDEHFGVKMARSTKKTVLVDRIYELSV